MARDLWRWSYSGSTLFPIIGSFAVTPVLTRILTPHDYAQVAVASLTVQVSGLVFALGSSPRIILTAARHGAAEARGLALSTLALSALMGLLAASVVTPFRHSQPWLPAASVALIGGIVAAGISNLLSLLRSLKIPKPYVAISASTSVVAPLCGILVLLLQGNSWSRYLLGLYAATAVTLAAGWASCRGPVSWNRSRFAESLKLGLPWLPHQVGIASLSLVYVALCSRKYGLAESASLQLGLYLASTITLAVSALNATWAPAVLGAEEGARMNVARRWIGRAGWMTAILYSMLAIFAPLASALIVPPSYDRSLIVQTAIIAGLSGVLTVTYTGESHFVLARGNTGPLSVVTPGLCLVGVLVYLEIGGISRLVAPICIVITTLGIAVSMRLLNGRGVERIGWRLHFGPLALSASIGAVGLLFHGVLMEVRVQEGLAIALCVVGALAIVLRRHLMTWVRK